MGSTKGVSIWPPAPDLTQGLPRYTSIQRPQQPYVGMLIWETDTSRVMQYQGATTGWTPPWNLAWGFMAEAKITSNSSALTSTSSVSGLSLGSLTVLKNRLIRLDIGCYTGTQVGAGTSQIQIWNGTTTQLQGTTCINAAGNGPGVATSYVDTPGSNTTVTYNFRIFTNGTSFLIGGAGGAPAFIRATDIGAAGVPA